MLTLRDCLDLADLTEDEIAAIAQHENIPAIVALELGHQLLRTPEDAQRVRQFIIDDIAAAQARHSCDRCDRFSLTLAQHLKDHPQYGQGESGDSPDLSELLAIGRAQQVTEDPEAAAAVDRRKLDDLRDARHRQDCCDCARRSLELVRALAADDQSAGPGGA